MKKAILWLMHQLNKFCFSDKHDDNCNGCPFKQLKKCPISIVHDHLGDALVDSYTWKIQ